MKTTPITPAFAAVCLGLLGFTGSARAAAVITGSAVYSTTTSQYTYSYSVTNTGITDDLALITLQVNTAAAILGISAPVGFTLTFDPSQGWVNFMEDGSILTPQTFAPGSTVGTFTFTSPIAPAASPFLAYDASGTEFSGFAAAPVPEPATGLFAALAAAGLITRRRRN